MGPSPWAQCSVGVKAAIDINILANFRSEIKLLSSKQKWKLGIVHSWNASTVREAEVRGPPDQGSSGGHGMILSQDKATNQTTKSTELRLNRNDLSAA